jgi:hypothetical protein
VHVPWKPSFERQQRQVEGRCIGVIARMRRDTQHADALTVDGTAAAEVVGSHDHLNPLGTLPGDAVGSRQDAIRRDKRAAAELPVEDVAARRGGVDERHHPGDRMADLRATARRCDDQPDTQEGAHQAEYRADPAITHRLVAGEA